MEDSDSEVISHNVKSNQEYLCSYYQIICCLFCGYHCKTHTDTQTKRLCVLVYTCINQLSPLRPRKPVTTGVSTLSLITPELICDRPRSRGAGLGDSLQILDRSIRVLLSSKEHEHFAHRVYCRDELPARNHASLHWVSVAPRDAAVLVRS